MNMSHRWASISIHGLTTRTWALNGLPPATRRLSSARPPLIESPSLPAGSSEVPGSQPRKSTAAMALENPGVRRRGCCS